MHVFSSAVFHQEQYITYRSFAIIQLRAIHMHSALSHHMCSSHYFHTALSEPKDYMLSSFDYITEGNIFIIFS